MIGTVLDDRYEIVALIATGGFGTIYRAHHKVMGNDVAIKVLHPRYAADPEGMKRFHREAHIISELRHQNIFSVYSFGNVDGLVYMATELLAGESLGSMVRERGPVPPDKALPLFLQVCDAMAFAHANAVFHRDLKPDNVIVVNQSDGTASAKLIDFGLAKLLDGPDGQRLTKTGEVLGDPNYMSPEQAQGQKLDNRSDIYSFGCLMYEVLTGEPPFAADTPVGVLMKQISAPPAPFAQRLGLPPSLEAIVFTCLTKNKELRYESFGALREVLDKFVADPSLAIKAPIHRATSVGKRRWSTSLAVLFVLGITGVVSVALVVSHLNDLRGEHAYEMQQVADEEELRNFTRNYSTYVLMRPAYSLEELQHFSEVARRKRDYAAFRQAELLKFQQLTELGDYERCLNMALADVQPSSAKKETPDTTIAQEIGPESVVLLYSTIAANAFTLGRDALAEEYFDRLLGADPREVSRLAHLCYYGPRMSEAKRLQGKTEEARGMMKKVVDAIRRSGELRTEATVRTAVQECMALGMTEEIAGLTDIDDQLAAGKEKRRPNHYLQLYKMFVAEDYKKRLSEVIDRVYFDTSVSDAEKVLGLNGLSATCLRMKRYDICMMIYEKLRSLSARTKGLDRGNAEVSADLLQISLDESKNDYQQAAADARALTERSLAETSGGDDVTLRWAWQLYVKQMDRMGKLKETDQLRQRVVKRLLVSLQAREEKNRQELRKRGSTEN